MSKLEIIQFVILTIVTVAVAVYYLIKAIKNNWIKQLIDTVENAVAEAETKYPVGSGNEKKGHVLNAVRLKCIELKIPYTIIFGLINKLVDKIVSDYNVIAKK